MRGIGQSQRVVCRCSGLKAEGTFEISGSHLILSSTVGVTKTVLGLQFPRRAAQRLLQHMCKREVARRNPAISDASVALPKMIEVVKDDAVIKRATGLNRQFSAL